MRKGKIMIIYHESSKTFHLYNNEISYIMCVLPNGHLGNLYFGKRIHDREDFSYLLEMKQRPMTGKSQIFAGASETGISGVW